jgi:hypothetical protein
VTRQEIEARSQERLRELHRDHPSVALEINGAPAVAIIVEKGGDTPYSAYDATDRAVVVYGLQAPLHKDGLWLLGSHRADLVSRHRVGRSLVIEIVKGQSLRLTPAQVAKIKDLLAGKKPPLRRERLSPLGV